MKKLAFLCVLFSFAVLAGAEARAGASLLGSHSPLSAVVLKARCCRCPLASVPAPSKIPTFFLPPKTSEVSSIGLRAPWFVQTLVDRGKARLHLHSGLSPPTFVSLT